MGHPERLVVVPRDLTKLWAAIHRLPARAPDSVRHCKKTVLQVQICLDGAGAKR